MFGQNRWTISVSFAINHMCMDNFCVCMCVGRQYGGKICMLSEEQFDELCRIVHRSIKQNEINYEEAENAGDMETANFYLGKKVELEALVTAICVMENVNL